MSITTANPQATAFVALDLSTYIVDRYSSNRNVAERAANALTSARAAGLPVFHVVPANMSGDIHPLLAPTEDEPVLAKTTMGAFASTSLHERLQAQTIRHIIVAGVATSGTVLSTTRWAVDLGYQVTVCSDACADPDPQVHVALIDPSVFSESWLGLWRIATVSKLADIDQLGPHRQDG